MTERDIEKLRKIGKLAGELENVKKDEEKDEEKEKKIVYIQRVSIGKILTAYISPSSPCVQIEKVQKLEMELSNLNNNIDDIEVKNGIKEVQYFLKIIKSNLQKNAESNLRYGIDTCEILKRFRRGIYM